MRPVRGRLAQLCLLLYRLGNLKAGSEISARRGAQLAVRCPGPSGSARCSKKRGRNRCGALAGNLSWSRCLSCSKHSHSVFRPLRCRPTTRVETRSPRTRLGCSGPALRHVVAEWPWAARSRAYHAALIKKGFDPQPLPVVRAFVRSRSPLAWARRAVRHFNWAGRAAGARVW